MTTRTNKGIFLPEELPVYLRQNNMTIPAIDVVERTCTKQPSNVHNTSPGYCLSENVRLREEGEWRQSTVRYKRQAEVVQTT